MNKITWIWERDDLQNRVNHNILSKIYISNLSIEERYHISLIFQDFYSSYFLFIDIFFAIELFQGEDELQNGLLLSLKFLSRHWLQ